MMKPLYFLLYKNINDVAYYVLPPNFLSFFLKFFEKNQQIEQTTKT